MRKALLGFFLCIFSSLTCLKKPVFSKRDLLRWKVTARLYWDLLSSGRYQSQISNHRRACVQALLLYIMYQGEPKAVPWHIEWVVVGNHFPSVE
jgi:hypothetical protein